LQIELPSDNDDAIKALNLSDTDLEKYGEVDDAFIWEKKIFNKS
jgi:hypothetical protein